MFFIILYGIWLAAFACGMGLSAVAVGVMSFMVMKDRKKRLYGWWVFGGATVAVLAVELILLNTRPKTINIPDSIDFKNMLLNSFGYGASLGGAALAGGLITWMTPRPPKQTISPVNPASRTV